MTLTQARNGYWADQVEIQRRASTAWLARAEGRASALAGDRDKARTYYGKLVALAKPTDSERPELREARAFLARR